MTNHNWICSHLPDDCQGPFRVTRRSRQRTDDTAECRMHLVPAWRPLTRRQRSILGLRLVEARDFVLRYRAQARDEADWLIDSENEPDLEDAARDGERDGPTEEPWPDDLEPTSAMTDRRHRYDRSALVHQLWSAMEDWR